MKNVTFKAVKFVGQTIHTTAVATQVISEEITGSIGAKLDQGSKAEIIEDMRKVSDKRVNQKLASVKKDLAFLKEGLSKLKAERAAQKEPKKEPKKETKKEPKKK
jgi:hypothetical protein